MLPGEIIHNNKNIEINAGCNIVTLRVSSKGDRPITLGSHIAMSNINPALNLSQEANGRLDIPSGCGIRFEPGDEKTIEVIQRNR